MPSRPADAPTPPTARAGHGRRALLLAGATLPVAGLLAACQADASNEPVTIAVTYVSGVLEPNGTRYTVGRGTQVTITLSADVEVHLHVHGYEKQLVGKPGGEVVSTSFVADMVGSYEIETHDPARVVAQLVVQ